MIIYGKNAVIEALKNKRNISKVYLANEQMKDIVWGYNKNIEIVMMPMNQMNNRFKGLHQGIAAESSAEYKYTTLKDLINQNSQQANVCLAMLDGLEDPHNLGAILRTADATGIDGIIIPKNRSVSLNETVAKVSTGAIEHVKVSQVTNLVAAIKDLKKAGYWVIGLEMEGSVDYRKQDYLGKIVVIIGSEGKGISRLVKEECDFMVNIPMVGHVTSLNASVSASILFYEVLRNRG